VAQPATGFVVYQRADGSLWRADGDGAAPVNLADPTEPEALLPWAASPDGKTIAVVTGKGLWYQFHDNPTLALWFVGADGSNPRKVVDLLPPRGVDPTPGGDDAFNLVPALTSQQVLAWSPDGQQVAFVSAHEGEVDLYTAALDGTLTRITSTPRLEQGPAWSPDGALLAYRTTSGFGTGAGWGEVAVEVTPRTGGAPAFVMDDRKLAAGSEAAVVEELIWADSDTLIAGLWDSIVGKAEVRALAISSRQTTTIFGEPYTALAWNGTTHQLAIAGTSAELAQSPPDGRKTAPGLFAWSADAGAPTRIDPESPNALAWAPQGDVLAFSVAGEKPAIRLWALGTDGDMKQIGAGPARDLLWSPDGQRLAADQTVYGHNGKQLADLPGDQLSLVGWAAQGLFYFTFTEGNSRDLWLWDGAQAHKIDTGITNIANAGVVLSGAT
jgi:Tol biopolymer transport system component